MEESLKSAQAGERIVSSRPRKVGLRDHLNGVSALNYNLYNFLRYQMERCRGRGSWARGRWREPIHTGRGEQIHTGPTVELYIVLSCRALRQVGWP